jgi:hypothetical protein
MADFSVGLFVQIYATSDEMAPVNLSAAKRRELL